jgi:two-component system sensor histidine kinase PilS (NtrC family)
MRPSWVIATRLVAYAVTVALAWPLLKSVPQLSGSLIIYTTATVTTVLAVAMGRRRASSRLASLLRAAQIICELVVVSQIVLHTGGMRSPSFYLYLTTIISAAVTYRLVGTLLVASAATMAYVMVIWTDAGHGLSLLLPSEWLGTVRQLSDEDFFTVFVRLCIFYLCAFIGGYLAERLSSNDEVLAHATEALKEAKLETGDILKHLNSGILTIDPAGRIVYFNRAAEEILGLSERRVRGRPLHDAFDGRFPELTDRLETVLHSQKMDTRNELVIHRRDGTKIPIGLSTSVLAGPESQIRGVIGIFQDLTEPKRLEEKLRAKDRMAAVGELSAAIAHEIRNPLAAISGSVEVLRNELKLDGENRRLLGLIIKESERLNKILTDFLLYARIRPTVTGRVNVSPVVDDVLEIARRHFQGRHVALRTHQPDRSLAVQADADHLKEMLINLVFNAVEAVEDSDGSVAVSVEVPDALPIGQKTGGDTRDPAGWVAVAVRDNGGGIPEGVRERLFEPFVSSKPLGTGLGLAITSRLVDNVGGAIAVESHPGKGTTFTILLPRCTAPVPPPPAESRPRAHRVPVA